MTKTTSNIAALIEGRTVGIVSAHPDDHIPHASLLWALQTQQPQVVIHELVHTRGEDGINFRPDEPDFVSSGKRVMEGQASAAHFNIQSYTQLDDPDGGLQGREPQLADATEAWAREHGISFFITLRTDDHYDHTAVADATREAARRLHAEGTRVRILELLPLLPTPDQSAEPVAAIEATYQSTQYALGAAACNRSQFEISTTQQAGWLAEYEYWIEPETYERLFQYPIAKPATYHVIDFTD